MHQTPWEGSLAVPRRHEDRHLTAVSGQLRLNSAMPQPEGTSTPGGSSGSKNSPAGNRCHPLPSVGAGPALSSTVYTLNSTPHPSYHPQALAERVPSLHLRTTPTLSPRALEQRMRPAGAACGRRGAPAHAQPVTPGTLGGARADSEGRGAPAHAQQVLQRDSPAQRGRPAPRRRRRHAQQPPRGQHRELAAASERPAGHEAAVGAATRAAAQAQQQPAAHGLPGRRRREACSRAFYGAEYTGLCGRNSTLKRVARCHGSRIRGSQFTSLAPPSRRTTWALTGPHLRPIVRRQRRAGRHRPRRTQARQRRRRARYGRPHRVRNRRARGQQPGDRANRQAQQRARCAAQQPQQAALLRAPAARRGLRV